MLAPSPYVHRRPPRAKQAEALERMRGREAFALLMSMRTGKTKCIIDSFGEMVTQDKVDDLLVTAPGGAYRTWEGEIEKDLPDDLIRRTLVHVWVSGATSAKVERQRELFLEFNGPRILLMNIEALSTVQAARTLCVQFLGQRRSMMVNDESTDLKNIKAKRTQFVLQQLVPLTAYRRILSGLPTPRSPLDLYSQFAILDPKILGFGSYYGFRARYAILKKVQFDRSGRRPAVTIVVGYRNVEELQQKIADHSFRVLLEDCYDLPASTYIIRDVALTDEQRRVYAELKKFATAELDSGAHVTATQVIVQIMRLHQVLCGHTVDENGVFRVIPEKRTAELIALLNETDSKAIIWCSYDADVHKVSEALAEEFGKESVARFWGGNRSTREDEERQFKTDPHCRFMVATAAAGGRGRTWDVADLVVYYSSTNNLEHRSQSEERPKGVDKVKPIAYVDLIARGTVEEKIIKALRAKIDLAAVITADNYRTWLV